MVHFTILTKPETKLVTVTSTSSTELKSSFPRLYDAAKVEFEGSLNYKGYPHSIIVSTVTTILLNGWILPIGEVSLGRVFMKFVLATTISSRLVD